MHGVTWAEEAICGGGSRGSGGGIHPSSVYCLFSGHSLNLTLSADKLISLSAATFLLAYVNERTGVLSCSCCCVFI